MKKILISTLIGTLLAGCNFDKPQVTENIAYSCKGIAKFNDGDNLRTIPATLSVFVTSIKKNDKIEKLEVSTQSVGTMEWTVLDHTFDLASTSWVEVKPNSISARYRPPKTDLLFTYALLDLDRITNTVEMTRIIETKAYKKFSDFTGTCQKVDLK